ncbi:MAG: hypothetical protein AAFM91_06025 [Pseudomonadota bacterium]
MRKSHALSGFPFMKVSLDAPLAGVAVITPGSQSRIGLRASDDHVVFIHNKTAFDLRCGQAASNLVPLMRRIENAAATWQVKTSYGVDMGVQRNES